MSFFVGVAIGLPVGCYLREIGFGNRLNKAFREIVPREKKDELVNEAGMFYQSMRQGMANPDEADRYIWGPSATTSKDDIDKQNDKLKKSRLDLFDVKKVLK